MEAKLVFDLPTENNELTLALKGQDLWSTLFEIDQWIRNNLKHGHNFHNADGALGETRNELNRIMEEHGLSMDMVS